LQQEHPAPSHGLSKAGIRKMIARLHEELLFTREARKCIPQSKDSGIASVATWPTGIIIKALFSGVLSTD